MSYYFYCPSCGKEEVVYSLPIGTVGNIRDGWGSPIYHYECSVCHNLDAGFMLLKQKTEDERKYFQHVIKMYQNIRGFKETNKI